MFAIEDQPAPGRTRVQRLEDFVEFWTLICVFFFIGLWVTFRDRYLRKPKWRAFRLTDFAWGGNLHDDMHDAILDALNPWLADDETDVQEGLHDAVDQITTAVFVVLHRQQVRT